jgi:hypothetical protein
MEDNLKITIKEYLGDDRYIDHILIIKAIDSITPWGNNPFRWEGEYKGGKISVLVNRGDSAEFANIIKPDSLNITDQIVSEINRVLRKLN